MLEEQPVFSVRDLFGQRRRWFNGQLSNLRNYPMPLKIKILNYLKLVIWFSAFPSVLVSWIAIFGYLAIPFVFDIPLAAKIFLIPGTLMWLLSYQIGVYYNTKYLRWPEKVWYHFCALLFIALVGLIEAYPAFTFFLSRKEGFFTVTKDRRRKL